MTIFIVAELATNHYLNQCRHDSSTHICSTEIQHPFDFFIFQNKVWRLAFYDVKVWLHCCYSKRTMTKILYLKCNIVANWYLRLSRQPCTHRFIDYNGLHICIVVYIFETQSGLLITLFGSRYRMTATSQGNHSLIMWGNLGPGGLVARNEIGQK